VNKGFVITTAGANRPCPAGVAVVSRADVVSVEELVASFVVHAAFVHVSHLPDIGIDETVTKIDIAGGADSQ
jgi:hypothetical protein